MAALEGASSIGARRSGTGSHPLRPNGRQRANLRVASHEPLAAPCTSIASAAYCEHDGVNRHGEGLPSTARWYHAMARSRRARITGQPSR